MKAQVPLRQGKGPAAQGRAWWPRPSRAPPSPYLGSTAQRHMSYGFIFPHLTTILQTIRMLHTLKWHQNTMITLNTYWSLGHILSVFKAVQS